MGVDEGTRDSLMGVVTGRNINHVGPKFWGIERAVALSFVVGCNSVSLDRDC